MAIVINYLNPATGTTPPTFAQSLLVNTVTATIFATSGPDTAAVVTHNLGLPPADISAGWPDIRFEPLDSLAVTNDWWIQSVDPNFLGLGRIASVNGQDTVPNIRLKVSRPWTGSR